MSGGVRVRARLAGASDSAVLRAALGLLTLRDLTWVDLREAAKAQDDDDGRHFDQAALQAIYLALSGDFSGFVDRVLARLAELLREREVSFPLAPGDAEHIYDAVREEGGVLLAELGFPDAAAAAVALRRGIAQRAPWLPDALTQAYRMGAAGAAGLPDSAPWHRAWEIAAATPPTDVQRGAIEHARGHAAAYLRPIANGAADDVVKQMLAVDQEIVRRRTLVGLRARIHPERLAGYMADLTGVKVDRGDGKMIWSGGRWDRDWRRVARTELAMASSHGHLHATLARHPANAQRKEGEPLAVPNLLAFKITQRVRRNQKGELLAPCEHCYRLWRADDATPKLYPLAEIIDNAENAGPPPRRAREWLPTVGPTHPNDLCGQLHVYVPGSEALYPGLAKQLERYRGRGFEGVG